jgi:hypothetical protein
MRNHLVWIGPLVVFAGAVSYFLVFVRWPQLRDFPWVNLPLVLVGLAASVAAFRRRRKGVRLSASLAWFGLCLSTLLAGLFCFYVFYLSSTLPVPTTTTVAMQHAPSFALADQDGEVVRLEELRGKNVVLVFFRGFW